MRRPFLLFALIVSFSSSYYAQAIETSQAKDDIALQKLWLLSDLQGLEEKVAKLDQPLARAVAKAEIADATWALDEVRAKKLLTEAFELTFPEEEERAKLRKRPIGAPPILPTPIGRARQTIRDRVLSVASRDKAFSNQLVQLGAEQLGRLEENLRYAHLANTAIKAGDQEAAVQYIFQAIEADPTHITWEGIISELATQDRAAADKVILQYLERLSAIPLSLRNGSAQRVCYMLARLVFPSSFNPDSGGQQSPSPGPVVMRAYVKYIIESFAQMEQREPGALRASRGFLLAAWIPLKKYAPELTGAFLEIEKLSRRPGEDASLPIVSFAEMSRERYEERARKNFESNVPNPLQIDLFISGGDFTKARKMIDKLADGPQKTQLIERANATEAISVARKGDTLEAQKLAEQLNKATSILQVYPVIIEKCAEKKDQTCVSILVYQAMKQLKRSDPTPPLPPAGIPVSVMATNQEFDPVLLSLSKLAMLIQPVNETLALEILDETVIAANASSVDTGQGRIGFDVQVFKKIVGKDEQRTRGAAQSLKDPLRQIVAYAAIYQWKAEELIKKIKAGQ